MALLAGGVAAAFVGFALIALSMPRHWQQVVASPQPVRARRSGRALGSGLLAAALALCVLFDGWSFGLILWVTTLSAAAILVAFVLAWRPHWLRWAPRVLHATR